MFITWAVPVLATSKHLITIIFILPEKLLRALGLCPCLLFASHSCNVCLMPGLCLVIPCWAHCECSENVLFGYGPMHLMGPIISSKLLLSIFITVVGCGGKCS